MEFFLEEVSVKDEPGSQDEDLHSVHPQWKINSNEDSAAKLESKEILSPEKKFQMNIAETPRNPGNFTSFESATCATVHHVDLDLSDMFLIAKTLKVEPIDVEEYSDDPLRLSDLNDKASDETANKSMVREASKNAKERKPRKEIRLKCETCGKIFLNAKDLSGHELTHAGVKPLKCEKCGMTCFSSEYLIKHMKTHHTEEILEKLLQCDLCTRIFKTFNGLTKHKLTHNAEILPFKCDTCGMRFSLTYFLEKHRSQCPTSIEMEPMENHKREKSYNCEMCERTFTTMGILKRHMENHVSTKSYECDVCGNEFAWLVQLNRHKEWHKNLEPYECNVCDKTFPRISDLNEHMLCHGVIRDRPHNCGTCGKGFFMASVLRKHMECHMDTESYMCDVCRKVFASQSHLYKHSLRHAVHKRHKCNHCKKDFSNSGYLRNHMLSHDTHRFHKYNVCEKAQVPHAREKKLKCDICNKRFAFNSHLLRHTRNVHKANSTCTSKVTL